MSQYVVDLESLAATWSKLVEYRNDIAHAQMRPNSISAPRLQAYVREKLLKELTTLFPHVTA